MSRRTRLAVIGAILVAAAGGVLILSRQPAPEPGNIDFRPTSTPISILRVTEGPTALPTALPPRPQPGYTPIADDIVSPIVIQRSPDIGEEQTPDNPIELVFDRAMDRVSVESAFQVVPAIDGSFNWIDDRTVQFTPAGGLARDSVYDIVVDQRANDTEGAPLNQAYQFRFATAGYLEVAQVIPAPNTFDVEPGNTQITIIFNRPVVPLTALEQQADLPQPFTLSDNTGNTVAGRGEWLNTSIFVFHPSAPLAGGTTYIASVSGLSDTDSNPMQGEYAWSFSTAPPEIVWVTPTENQTLVPIDAPITVQFNQPIDPESARSKFELIGAGQQSIAGEFSILSETLTFTPTQPLAFDTLYGVQVDAGVISRAGGEGSREGRQWLFTSVPLPAIVRTEPTDGSRDAQPYTAFTIYFNTPINPDTIMPRLRMTPAFSPTLVYTYFNTYDNSFVLSYDVKPSTDYTVEVSPGITDPYGNTIDEPLTVRYRTAPLPPSMQLNTAGFVATYNANDPIALFASHTNITRIDLNLYALNREQASAFQRDPYNYPLSGAPLRTWSTSIDAPQNELSFTRLEVTEADARLEPGFYVLDANSSDIPQDQFSAYYNRHVLVVSAFNVVLKTAKDEVNAWVTDLRTGAPRAGVALTFYDYNGDAVISATSDANGIASATYDSNVKSIAFAVSEAPFTAGSPDWYNGIGIWEFGFEPYYSFGDYNAFIYTDRPIYRPDQTVDFKGIVRAEDDVRYSLPSNLQRVQVQIYNPNYELILDKQLPLSELGTFNDQLTLGADAALGQYQINITFLNETFTQAFTVAAYRPPEFEVVVTPDADEIVRGEATQAAAQARFFFGGGLANTTLNWNILAEDYSFNPPISGNYSFRDTDDPWICFDCWWYRSFSVPEPILSGSSTTDAQGSLTIDIPAQLAWASTDTITRSVSLIVEASATGPDNQVIAGRGTLVRHAGDLYVGLSTRDYIAIEDRPTTTDLIAVDWEGTRLPNREISVSTYRRDWINTFVENEFGGGFWEYNTQDTLVDTETLTTDDLGEAEYSFTPAEGGTYRIVAEAVDRGGRTLRSSTFLWVTGSEYISWRRENNDRVTLIGDKTSYQPGETAEILIPSPFEGEQYALITVERGGVLRSEVQRLTSNSTIYRLPITAEHAPNIYVSVVLVKGQNNCQGVACLEPENLADYKVGILPIDVPPTQQTLNIELTPNVEQAQPGDAVSYEVQVTDASGAPVAGELSLDLVDKAVLSLLPRTPDAIVQGFYGRRGLGVTTSSGLSVSGNRILQQIQEQLDILKAQLQSSATTVAEEAEGLGLPEAPAPAPAAQATSTPGGADDAFESARAFAADGDLANANAANIEVREEFADTAFWRADFTTDITGRGTLTVTLPDNLTTWSFRGVGITADTKVGEGTVDIIATKPLLIRPVAPRFFVVGDRAILAANVSNNTDSLLAVDVSLTADGLTFNTDALRTVTIGARSETKVEWDVTVNDVENAQLIFTAVSGELNDASKPRLATGPDGSLKVFRYVAPEIIGTAGQITEGGQRTEVVALPPRYDERQGEVTIHVDPSLAAATVDALDYLEHYEYECTEQTVSRFLPNVLTYRALQDLDIDDAELQAKLPDLVREGLDRLYLQQHGDGGWGWWVDDDSNVYISAWVVYGMQQARAAGFDVRADVIASGEQYLLDSLTELRDLRSYREANRQAFVLFVLSEDGRAAADRLDATFEAREQLSHYARAYLALAIGKNNVNDVRVQTLLSDLNNRVILSATGAHWEEDSYDWWAMNTDTRSTAIILTALARLDPDNALNPNVVRWLMVARKEGIWETTQETAWALIGLTEWMRVTGELRPNYDYAVFLNDVSISEGSFTPTNVRESAKLGIAVRDLLSDVGNRLTFSRGPGDGRLYYTAHLRVHIPVEDVEAANRGVSVSRRYTLASCEEANRNLCPEVNAVQLGDVIRVDLTIIAPNDLYYVVVEDPLPAGAEAIDTGLATTSLLEQPPTLSPSEPFRGGGFVDDFFYYPWWNWYSRSELRDEKVVLFADYLPNGTYEYSYTMRATLPGDYQVIPTLASEFYFPEVFGRSAGRLLSITG